MNKEFINILEKIENTLNTALPDTPDSSWTRDAFGTIAPCISQDHFIELIEPCKNLIKLGGKRWRPLLLVLCARLVSQSRKTEFDEKKAYSLTPLVEFAHNASLIHDDIEDSADTRRGKPCAHITYGMDRAINAGSWLYFEGATAILSGPFSDSEKLKLYELFLRELRLLHLGQAMDIKWHRNKELIPTQDEYKAMVSNKTGTLARLAVEAGFFAGGASEKEILEAGKIAQDIGVGFQIIDDVTNLTTGNPGKKRGDDIVEGKKSLPVLIHLQNRPSDKKALADLFSQAAAEGIDSPAVEKAIELLNSSGAVREAQKAGFELAQASAKKLAEFFGVKTDAGSLIEELFTKMLQPK